MALTPQQSQELKAIVEQRRAALLREVGRDLDATRARMDEGSYGICSNCGQDIGFERLRANPGAERCIRCQTLYEKTHAGANAPRLQFGVRARICFCVRENEFGL